ncbi:MAG TPA: hypothetical protein VM939_11810, partial [Gemmatimonadaceae bacterium]|nr:hypothetical protein [Gemmatimonadaceae bacterium]
TIRSRTVAVRVLPLPDDTVRAFIRDPILIKALGPGGSDNEKVQVAAGSPGNLFGDGSRGRAMATARRLIEAALSPAGPERHSTALAVGGSGSRGAFTDVLDAMLLVLGERMRAALHANNERAAAGASRAADAVGRARLRAAGNVNPQLLTARLLRELSASLS